MTPLIGSKISHYEILSELGRGGMGVVYRAKDTRLNRAVALKFLPADRTYTEKRHRRLIQEAEATSALNHPNILTIHDIDEHEGRTYIVMEFVDGQSLEQLLEKKQLKEAEIVRIATGIAEGLKAAHDTGIIHRDIKPANVMIRKDGLVKVMDFGLAKVSGSSTLTVEGGVLGTASYMSPEQARGEEVDARSDIWSLGVVLYEMVSGNRPFKGAYMPALVYAVVNEDPPPLSSPHGPVSSSLAHVVHLCLDKEPARRYVSADNLLVDLRDLSAGHRPSSKSVIRGVLPRHTALKTSATASGPSCLIRKCYPNDALVSFIFSTV